MPEEKLPISKRILLVLAFLADCLDEARLLGGLVGVTYNQVYGWVPPQYKRHNFYNQVRRFVKKGYARKKREGKSSILAITAEGRINSISLHGHFWPTEWDGFWTLAFFDIQETSRRVRRILRTLLKRLKFGMLQRSVWIFPGDFVTKLRRIIKENNLQESVLIISSDDLGVKDLKGLVEKIWPISSLNKKYKKSIERIKKIQPFPLGKQEERMVKCKDWLLNLLAADPMLPLPLLPKDWFGKQAVEIVLKLERNLSAQNRSKTT